MESVESGTTFFAFFATGFLLSLLKNKKPPKFFQKHLNTPIPLQSERMYPFRLPLAEGTPSPSAAAAPVTGAVAAKRHRVLAEQRCRCFKPA